MAFWNRKDDGRERVTKVPPQVEAVRKRYASGLPRLLPKSDERTLRSEFTRVMGTKAAEHADWVVLWHEPSFRYVKEVEVRRILGSTHETRKGEMLYIIPDANERNFDPFALRVVDGDGEEAGFLSMRDETAREACWEALMNGRVVVAVPKRNKKPEAALFVWEG